MGFEKDFSDKIIKVGIIGLGQRGAVLLCTIMACEEAKVTVLCDLYDDRMQTAQDRVVKKYGEKPATYSDFHLLVDDENVDVVLVSAAWEVHVDIAVECMEKGKIVALEVGGAYKGNPTGKRNNLRFCQHNANFNQRKNIYDKP